MRKILAILLCLLFCFEQTGLAQPAPSGIEGLSGQVNISGHLAGLSDSFVPDVFRPLHLRYLQYLPEQNSFRLLLDKGTSSLRGSAVGGDEAISKETQTLLKYFFIGLTLPNDSFWVNLRPDSPDNIIDFYLAQTDVGKILLETDLQLKKGTARFTSPETPEGKAYWDKLYKKAGELFGTENITIPTLTRPWIVPDEIIIRETPGPDPSAYIYKATLKVMLEEDYLKNENRRGHLNVPYDFTGPRLKELNEYSSQIIRETIIPKLTKEINSSKRYAALRQVYYSLILAQWFKTRYQQVSLPGASPQKVAGDEAISNLINSRNLAGLRSKEFWSKHTYFHAYKENFEKGEYNIKEPVYSFSAAGGSAYAGQGQTIRSHFSGGVQFGALAPQGAFGDIPQGASISMSSNRQLPQGEFLMGVEAEFDPKNGEIHTKVTPVSSNPAEPAGGVSAHGDTTRPGDQAEAWAGEESIALQEFDDYARLSQEKEKPVRSPRLRYMRVSGDRLIDVDHTYATKVQNNINPFVAYHVGWGGLLIAKDLKFNERIITTGITSCIVFAFRAQTSQGPIYGIGHYAAEAPQLDNLINLFHDFIARLPEDARSLELVVYSNNNGSESRKKAEVERFKAAVKDKFPSVAIIDRAHEGMPYRTNIMVSAYGWAIDRHSPPLAPSERDIKIGNWMVGKSQTTAAAARDGRPEIATRRPSRQLQLLTNERIGGLSKARDAFKQQQAARGRVIPEWSGEYGTFWDSLPEMLEDLIMRFGLIDPEKKVLDVGTGDAFTALVLAAVTGAQITSVEIHPGRYQYAVDFINFLRTERGIFYPNLTISREDFLRHPVNDYDAVYFYYTFPREKRSEFIQEILAKLSRELKLGAVFISPMLGVEKDAIERNIIQEYLKNHQELTQEEILVGGVYTRVLRKIDTSTAAPIIENSGGFDISDFQRGSGQANSLSTPQLENALGGVDGSTRSARSPSIPQQGELGGIDFRALPIVSQAIGNLSMNISGQELAVLKKVDLSNEWREIERLTAAGITPSSQRIKEYLQASAARRNLDNDLDKVITCISDILRHEEESCCATEAQLRDILVVLESARSAQDLKAVFLGK